MQDDPFGYPKWITTGSSQYLVAFFILIVTISSTVGECHKDQKGVNSDETLKNFKAAATTSFGTISLASLIISSIQILQLIVRFLKKKEDTLANNHLLSAPQILNPISTFTPTLLQTRRPASRSRLLRLSEWLLSKIAYLVEQINTYTLTYAALTGDSFLESARECTRIFKRNGDFMLVASSVSRVIVVGVTVVVGLVSGSVLLLWSVDNSSGSEGRSGMEKDGREFGWIAALVAGTVQYYVVLFMAHVVQNT
ncbi:hypothetical protein HK096_010723 [Nowakowskiella sp. JEL0078]|nr:hypothetical protein HK096_010723 [Nowakowskiella sp. JEL0078]